MNARHQELKASLEVLTAREARNPGLWDEEIEAVKGKLSRFEPVELNHCYRCGAKVAGNCPCSQI